MSSESQALQRAIRQIQEKFIEAKDEYEVALESQGTTYAVEDNETARQIASELSEVYDGVMKGGELSDDEKQTVKEKLSARIRELTSEFYFFILSELSVGSVWKLIWVDGVENNLHDSD